MGFPRQEYWSGLPILFPGDLPDPGIKPVSPALAGQILYHCATWDAPYIWIITSYGTPLQYACLENPMDGGAWWAEVHGVARNQT